LPPSAGAFALSGPAGRLVPALGPRRALAIALSIALLALAGPPHPRTPQPHHLFRHHAGGIA
jgi:hypothetical protein